jgi:hypothetical protein
MSHAWGKKRNENRVLVGKSEKERGHLENLGVNGRILQRSVENCDGKAWAEFNCVGVGMSDEHLWIW